MSEPIAGLQRPNAGESWVFVTGSRNNMLFVGGMFATVGAIILLSNVLWMLGIVATNGKAKPTTADDYLLVVAALVFGSLASYLAWRYLRQTPHVVMLTAEGALSARMALGTTRVPIANLQSICRGTRKLGAEGQDARVLSIRYSGGTLRVPYFDDAENLVEQLIASNPLVKQEGIWPSAD